VLLSVVLIAGVATGCGIIADVYKVLSCIPNPGACGDEPNEHQPAVDCIQYLNGQSVGTALCGPPWDGDNDTISTATETNPTNRIGNVPIAGFYTFDVARWDLNLSQSRGEPGSSGTLYKGMNLRDTEEGYVHYNGQYDPVDSDDWGTGHLVRLIEAAGRDWGNSPPRMQPGDLSLRTGGQFCTEQPPPAPPVCHYYHRSGLDVDIRYVRDDGQEIPLDICSSPGDYHGGLTLDLLNAIRRSGNGRNGAPRVDSIFLDMTASHISNTDPDNPIVFDKPGHCNHFHVMILDPDGIN
jgi:hypothetical protein